MSVRSSSDGDDEGPETIRERREHDPDDAGPTMQSQGPATQTVIGDPDDAPTLLVNVPRPSQPPPAREAPPPRSPPPRPATRPGFSVLAPMQAPAETPAPSTSQPQKAATVEPFKPAATTAPPMSAATAEALASLKPASTTSPAFKAVTAEGLASPRSSSSTTSQPIKAATAEALASLKPASTTSQSIRVATTSQSIKAAPAEAAAEAPPARVAPVRLAQPQVVPWLAGAIVVGAVLIVTSLRALQPTPAPPPPPPPTMPATALPCSSLEVRGGHLLCSIAPSRVPESPTRDDPQLKATLDAALNAGLLDVLLRDGERVFRVLSANEPRIRKASPSKPATSKPTTSKPTPKKAP